MARKANEPEGREARRQVDIDADLLRKARQLAAALDISAPDYISNRLRPIIEAEHRAMQREGQPDDAD